MCLDSYLQGVLIRSRMAEARQQAARRQLLQEVKREEAKRANAGVGKGAFMKRLVRAVSLLRAKPRVERTVGP